MSPSISRPGRHAVAGFTLAEVLVTILIMSGILVAITQILHTARISRDNIHNIQETQLAGPAILDLIDRDIRGLLIYNRTRKDHIRIKNRIMQGANADSIDFVTTTDNLVGRYDGDRFLRSTINEIGYRLRPNPDYSDFLEIYRREDMGVDDLPFEGGEFVFLHDRVKNFDIQVFAEDGPDAEAYEDWGTDEDSEEIGLPARLEITLTLELRQRLQREALRLMPDYMAEVTYRRVIRLPQELRVAEEGIVVPLIPSAEGAAGDSTGTGGGGDALPAGGGTSGTGGGGNTRTETATK